MERSSAVCFYSAALFSDRRAMKCGAFRVCHKIHECLNCATLKNISETLYARGIKAAVSFYSQFVFLISVRKIESLLH